MKELEHGKSELWSVQKLVYKRRTGRKFEIMIPRETSIKEADCLLYFGLERFANSAAKLSHSRAVLFSFSTRWTPGKSSPFILLYSPSLIAYCEYPSSSHLISFTSNHVDPIITRSSSRSV